MIEQKSTYNNYHHTNDKIGVFNLKLTLKICVVLCISTRKIHTNLKTR